MSPAPAGEALNLTRYCLAAHAEAPASAARPAFTFVWDEGAESWTYAEVWARVNRIGRGLLARGLAPGDRILIGLAHSPAYAFAFFGATLAGLIPVPASPELTAAEAGFLVRDAEPRAILTTPERRIDGFGGVVISADELTELDGDGELPETHAEEPAYLIYTSGSSAQPKGVLHPHRTVYGRALMRKAWEGFGPTDVTLHAGTLNWSYAMGVGLMDPWAAEAHAILYGGRRDHSVWLRLMERYRVTVFSAVPTIYRQLCKYGRPEEAGLGAVRHAICAGEALAPEVLADWERRTDRPLYEALGMTEISTYISAGPETPVRPGSPGRPQAGRRIAILPEAGGEEPLPPGAVGLLAVHRSDPGLMLGYWRRPEEEAAVYRGAWFVGGDLASMDADGYVWFQGRADDSINAFGYRLSPVEIESVLQECPEVADVAVVGVAIERGKTLVTACVVPQEGAALTGAALAAHAARHLAAYKRPHQYRFFPALPRTDNGKLQRRALVAQILGARDGESA